MNFFVASSDGRPLSSIDLRFFLSVRKVWRILTVNMIPGIVTNSRPGLSAHRYSSKQIIIVGDTRIIMYCKKICSPLIHLWFLYAFFQAALKRLISASPL
jgi:hypothetical protein